MKQNLLSARMVPPHLVASTFSLDTIVVSTLAETFGEISTGNVSSAQDRNNGLAVMLERSRRLRAHGAFGTLFMLVTCDDIGHSQISGLELDFWWDENFYPIRDDWEKLLRSELALREAEEISRA